MAETAENLVDLSLRILESKEEEARMAFYQRLYDHYTGDLEGYFEKFYAETDERFKQRPKKVLTMCQSALEVLTGSCVGEGVQINIGDEGSQKVWDEIEAVNSIQDQYALTLAETVGLFGWAVNRALPALFPMTRAGDMEFEAVDPRYFRLEHNRASVGRSVKRIDGVAFDTIYDPDQGRILPADTPLGTTSSRTKKRVEIITPDEWMIYLDGEPTPRNPGTGELWVPTEDGNNPFGIVMAVPVWNVWQAGAFEGRSDLDPSYKTAEDINLAYSQLIYNILHYFSTLTSPQGETGTQSPERRGIGLMLRYPKDGQPPTYITPGFDVAVLLEPLKLMLNLFFSFAHTPAAAHGLGTMTGSQKGAESGKAKHYEFHRMSQHVQKKRRNFTAGMKSTYRMVAQGLSNAGIQGLKPDAEVTVEYRSEIVPVSMEEVRDGILLEMEKGVRSVLSAVMAIHGIEDEATAQKMVNEIALQAGKAKPMSRAEVAMQEEISGGGE